MTFDAKLSATEGLDHLAARVRLFKADCRGPHGRLGGTATDRPEIDGDLYFDFVLELDGGKGFKLEL
jgi:hypothetical protein